MRQILVGTDFSAPAARALEVASELAALFDAQIEVLACLHFLPNPLGIPERFEERSIRQARESLEALAKPVRDRGRRLRCTTTLREPSAGLRSRARDIGADLIAVGTRGSSGLAHTLLGSVAERTARLSKVPVLTTHEHAPVPFEPYRIAVGIDFSPDSMAALAFAHRLACRRAGELLLVHCGRHPDGSSERLEHLASLEEFAIEDCRVSRVYSSDPPRDVLLEIAHDTANLIVVGARGATGVVHGALGGTAEQIIRSAEVPVITVPTAPAPHAEGAQLHEESA